MKILFCASEAAPFVKTGGLADVAGSLPKACKERGVDIRVVLPLYKNISEKYSNELMHLGEYYVNLAWRVQYAGIKKLGLDGITYYFIDNQFYFHRGQIYGERDDGERFAYFSKAICDLPKFIDFKPDIMHTNDWHTALINIYIKEYAKFDPYYRDIKTICTIHNLKYQGVFGNNILEDVIGISSKEYFHEEKLKFYDAINYLKGGIVFSDALTTVSKSYADEMKYSYYGEGLEGIIREHEHKLRGILNGIDNTYYNPSEDPCIHAKYNLDIKSYKNQNKTHIQKEYGLPVNEKIPMIAMVTRLVEMKGIDLILHNLHELLQEEIQFVILGTGDNHYEETFKYFEKIYRKKVASRIYFSEAESRQIYAASDIFVMPSKSEPCGLSQLIALRYGSVPIVRAVGGLKDSIIDYSKDAKEGNGFVFENYNAHELLFKIKDALQLYANKVEWDGLVRQGMKSINTWSKSSKEYVELYKSLSKGSKG